MIEEAKFTYFTLGKALEKKIEDQGETNKRNWGPYKRTS